MIRRMIVAVALVAALGAAACGSKDNGGAVKVPTTTTSTSR